MNIGINYRYGFPRASLTHGEMPENWWSGERRKKKEKKCMQSHLGRVMQMTLSGQAKGSSIVPAN